MNNANFATIIVSGGYSSRMGSFKPFLRFGDKSAIEMIIETYKRSGIDKIIVVAGFNGSEVAEKLKEAGTICIQNENYADGMFTSVLKGVKALDTNVSAFFMHPVDIPLVKKQTIEALKNKYLEMDKGIIYPDFCGRIGHPPLIDCKHKEAIMNSNGEGGLKMILEKYSNDSTCVPVYDKSVLMDMDTKNDYDELLGYFEAAVPDLEECCSILDIYKVSENTIRHCRKVTEIATEILHCLDIEENKLNEGALMAAAMLHDIARKEKNHAKAGERLLVELGYAKVGSIIGTHMDIAVDETAKITENEILYLADKLVRDDIVVSIDERFKQCLNRFKDDPEILRSIEYRKDAAYKIVKKIVRVTGKGFIYG